MLPEDSFKDYYRILQVAPDCDVKALEAAYRRLAKIYHPDHTVTADPAKFSEITEAYKTLRDPEKREGFDSSYAGYAQPHFTCDQGEAENLAGFQALRDADDHTKILVFLYKRRRDDASNPGVVGYYLQDYLGCTHEHFEFHKWYLKEKGFIQITEQGTLAITIQGVDEVISTSRTARVEKLLIANSADGATNAP
ncbi:J domain-containing protein [Sphingomonas lutea]|uniref:J domain-containing protein n=1 Tax=Sphingomonas lutea TaxID=1045317 RepID=A0A7G9SJ59_9SPHN|nr:J domain-containing protein [Sphingomonas lutea]QNN67884.1 J domain-containing protein [Sphingomonas lutea]